MSGKACCVLVLNSFLGMFLDLELRKLWGKLFLYFFVIFSRDTPGWNSCPRPVEFFILSQWT